MCPVLSFRAKGPSQIPSLGQLTHLYKGNFILFYKNNCHILQVWNLPFGGKHLHTLLTHISKAVLESGCPCLVKYVYFIVRNLHYVKCTLFLTFIYHQVPICHLPLIITKSNMMTFIIKLSYSYQHALQIHNVLNVLQSPIRTQSHLEENIPNTYETNLLLYAN